MAEATLAQAISAVASLEGERDRRVSVERWTDGREIEQDPDPIEQSSPWTDGRIIGGREHGQIVLSSAPGGENQG
ncbi:hypothetical protein [Microbacterium oxydans]|uniref:hypothetical protein n=1 Tax=Microbacterium oxydans TaxID=82380 RepID=UPI003D806411